MERVTVAQLKSRLSHYLREVRSGKSFTVVSRDIPVATLGPHDALADDGLVSIPPNPSAPPLSAPVFGGPADAPDAVELIREGRADRSEG
jgi:prevent-host-death family protein